MREASSRGDTRGRIIDQATRLLQEHGPAAVTTRGVAEAAGVQAPTIYRFFGDKDGLLDAVAEHVLATYVSTKAAATAAASAADVDPVADLRSGWRTQIEFSLANPTLFALLSDPERADRSPAATAGKRVLAAKVHRLAAAGRLRVTEPRAADLIHAAGTGAVLAILATPAADRDPSLAEDMLDAVLGRILVDAPVDRSRPERAAAIALRAAAPGLAGLTDAERALLAEWLDRFLGEPAPARSSDSAASDPS